MKEVAEHQACALHMERRKATVLPNPMSNVAFMEAEVWPPNTNLRWTTFERIQVGNNFAHHRIATLSKYLYACLWLWLPNESMINHGTVRWPPCRARKKHTPMMITIEEEFPYILVEEENTKKLLSNISTHLLNKIHQLHVLAKKYKAHT